jgi:hypothetical protein
MKSSTPRKRIARIGRLDMRCPKTKTKTKS